MAVAISTKYTELLKREILDGAQSKQSQEVESGEPCDTFAQALDQCTRQQGVSLKSVKVDDLPAFEDEQKHNPRGHKVKSNPPIRSRQGGIASSPREVVERGHVEDTVERDVSIHSFDPSQKPKEQKDSREVSFGEEADFSLIDQNEVHKVLNEISPKIDVMVPREDLSFVQKSQSTNIIKPTDEFFTDPLSTSLDLGFRNDLESLSGKQAPSPLIHTGFEAEGSEDSQISIQLLQASILASSKKGMVSEAAWQVGDHQVSDSISDPVAQQLSAQIEVKSSARKNQSIQDSANVIEAEDLSIPVVQEGDMSKSTADQRDSRSNQPKTQQQSIPPATDPVPVLRAAESAMSDRTFAQNAQLKGQGGGGTLSSSSSTPEKIDGIPITLGQSGMGKASAAQMTSVLSPTSMTERIQVLQQIQAGMKAALQKGESHMLIQLRPDALGSVDIRLDIARDGTVSALFRATSSEALDILSSHASEFLKTFQEANLNLEAHSLNFGLQGEDSSYQGSQQGNQSGDQKSNRFDPSVIQKPNSIDQLSQTHSLTRDVSATGIDIHV